MHKHIPTERGLCSVMGVCLAERGMVCRGLRSLRCRSHFYVSPLWPEALFSLQPSLLQSPAIKGVYGHDWVFFNSLENIKRQIVY